MVVKYKEDTSFTVSKTGGANTVSLTRAVKILDNNAEIRFKLRDSGAHEIEVEFENGENEFLLSADKPLGKITFSATQFDKVKPDLEEPWLRFIVHSAADAPSFPSGRSNMSILNQKIALEKQGNGYVVKEVTAKDTKNELIILPTIETPITDAETGFNIDLARLFTDVADLPADLASNDRVVEVNSAFHTRAGFIDAITEAISGSMDIMKEILEDVKDPKKLLEMPKYQKTGMLECESAINGKFFEPEAFSREKALGPLKNPLPRDAEAMSFLLKVADNSGKGDDGQRNR